MTRDCILVPHTPAAATRVWQRTGHGTNSVIEAQSAERHSSAFERKYEGQNQHRKKHLKKKSYKNTNDSFNWKKNFNY